MPPTFFKPRFGSNRVASRKPAVPQNSVESPLAQPVTPAPQGIYPRLRVGAVNDPLEREADQIADTVMRMPGPVSASSAERGVQRKPGCACGGVCPKCQTDSIQASRSVEDEVLQRQGEEEEEEEVLQRKSSGGPMQVSSGAGARINSLKGGGQPLPASTQQFFSSRMNYDFSQVRVHSGTPAAEAAQSVNARAFTLGNDVVFNRQEFQPESSQGRRLLAHELTHVMQQNPRGNETSQGIQRDSETLRRTSYSDCEGEHLPSLRAAVRKATEDMGTAISMLGQQPLSTHVSDALWLMFRDRSGRRARSAAARLRRIVDGLPDVTIECENPVDSESLPDQVPGWVPDMVNYPCSDGDGETAGGYVPLIGIIAGDLSMANIHICMGSWDRLNDVEHAHVIVHEGMHRFNFASDYGYFKIRDCTETPETAAAAATVTPPLIPASRTDNADCYACLVRLLVNMSASEVAARVSLYQGGTLTLSQSPEGTVDLNGSQNTPVFTMRIPDPSNPEISQIPSLFQFRWLLIDENRQEYHLRDLFSDNNLRRFGPNPSAIIPNSTRALLRERGVRTARVYCRYGMQGVGTRLFSRRVQFTF